MDLQADYVGFSVPDELDVYKRQALDMALGRGGDQAAVKSKEGFDFYGGVSRSVEKRSKVKSRIIAAAVSYTHLDVYKRQIWE